MTANRTAAVLERDPSTSRPTESGAELFDAGERPVSRIEEADASREGRLGPNGPRRWNDPDEKMMLWGALFFFGLGLYAAAFVVFGMWLTP